MMRREATKSRVSAQHKLYSYANACVDHNLNQTNQYMIRVVEPPPSCILKHTIILIDVFSALYLQCSIPPSSLSPVIPSSPSAMTHGSLLPVSTPRRRRAQLGSESVDELHELDEQDEASIYMSPSIISLHSIVDTVTSAHDDDITVNL